jgi:hypothetical protein
MLKGFKKNQLKSVDFLMNFVSILIEKDFKL